MYSRDLRNWQQLGCLSLVSYIDLGWTLIHGLLSLLYHAPTMSYISQTSFFGCVQAVQSTRQQEIQQITRSCVRSIAFYHGAKVPRAAGCNTNRDQTCLLGL